MKQLNFMRSYKHVQVLYTSDAKLNMLVLKHNYDIRCDRDTAQVSIRQNNNLERRASLARKKHRICTWLGPSDKFQRNLAGRAIAFLFSPEWKSSKNEGTSRARTCLEKFRENVRGNPLSVTSLSFDFLSITCFSPLYDLPRACDDSAGQHERINTIIITI